MRKTGVVKWFNNIRGYGFISQDGDENIDVFIHYSEIKGSNGFKTLKEKDKVEYELAQDGKGYKAINLNKI